MAQTVSVVTPSLNQAAYLPQAIESVLRQGVPALEYVVVDGGSTDGSPSILQSYGSRLRWVSEPDRGQAHAVNKGLASTSGEIIGWLNSDDVYYEGAIAAGCALLASQPEVDVVYGRADHLDMHGQVIGPYPTEPWELHRLPEVCYICQPAVFFRRRVLERHGLLDERLHYCLDYEYWLRLGLRGVRFAYLDRALAGSRVYPETKTVNARLETYQETNEMLRRTLGAVPASWLFNYAHIAVEERGIPREQALRFAAAITATTLYAAFRWNGHPSRRLLRLMAGWVRRHTSARLAQRRLP